MSAFSEKFQRSVIPRWHDSREASFAHEAQSLKQHHHAFAADTSLIREELLQTRSLGVAVDALNAALVAKDMDTATIAAEIVHSQGIGLPAPILSTARSVLGLDHDELPILTPFVHVHHQRIAELRAVLRTYPRSPIVHLDLARHYLTIGQVEKATRAVKTALTLNPCGRTTLRAGARFFVSVGEAERAYHLIRTAAVTRSDPWLVAAEIALGELVDKTPRYWAVGRELLRREAFSPYHLSELASAAATREMLAGNTRDAKKLFRQGIRAPTENTLAQMRWAEGRIGTVLATNGTAPYDGSDAPEADFFRLYQRGEMQEAFECGKRWFYSEPFSSTAASATAHAAALLDDYKAVEEFARLGLLGHQSTTNLRNNLLYAKISSGWLAEGTPQAIEARARAVVRELRRYVDAGGWDGLHAMANLGLVAFRLGDPDAGRGIYERTIEAAQQSGNRIQAATAAVFLARESILSGSPWASQAMDRARSLAKPFTAAPALTSGVFFYLKKVEALAKNPKDAAYILSAQSMKDFAKPKGPVPFRVTRNSDGRLVVWVPRNA